MKISVIGCGYLGAVHAACMAELGHEVIGIDVDAAKVQDLTSGRCPFFEPGLSELLTAGLSAGRLKFSSDLADAKGAQAHFVCVGTPQLQGGDAADLRFVDAAFTELARHLNPGDVVVGKSTVPVGTAERLAREIQAIVPDASVAWNPEFLREGHAIKDTVRPNRLVYGVPDGAAGVHAASVLDAVYTAPLENGAPRMVLDFATAELVKTAANAFLATKISFINAMAEVCDAAGADVTLLADAIGIDDRIGRKFLDAGVGFGGGCLPKDIRAFMARTCELGADQALAFLREVDATNMRQRTRAVELTRALCGGSLMGKRITILGAAFKPNSDDVRDSPALSVAAQLQLQGAAVTVTDPEALANSKGRFPELTYEPILENALSAANAVVLLTQWDQFVRLDPAVAGELVRERNILDGRNALDPGAWRAAGWNFKALGRP